MSKLPKLDKRDSEDLFNEVKFLASRYTPEWSIDESSSDFGVVLAKTFCNMTQGTISRYNKTVYNYYLTFLNMLGTKLKPACAANGMVIIKTNKNDKGVYIDKAMSLFASSDNEEGMVTYETVDPLTAIDTSIEKIYSTDSRDDFISLVYDKNPVKKRPKPVDGSEDDENEEDEESQIIDEDLENDEEESNIKPFRIFDNVFGENIQSHEIYFYDDVIFDMSNTDLTFNFYDSLSASNQSDLPKIFSDSENVLWQYYDGKQWKNANFYLQDKENVKVKFKGKTNESKILGKQLLAIRCKFKKIPEKGVHFTSVYYSSHSEKTLPDSIVVNESEANEKDFFPFEEKMDMYNMMYLQSDEILTKKNSTVTIEAQVQFVKIKTDMQTPGKIYKSIMNESDFADMKPGDIKIEEVKWEYWNGNGWAKLDTDEKSSEFFDISKEESVTRTLSFTCPSDIDTISIGAKTGYFIRARISKMNNRFEFYADYISPYIHEIKIKYDYGEYKHKVRKLIVKSNLAEKKLKLSDKIENVVLEKSFSRYPAMYFCLSKPLVSGLIRIFIDIEEGIHRFNPSINWQYLAENNKGGTVWKNLQIMDETNELAHSGSITMIGKDDFAKSKIFGQEGYYIRIINPDGKYSDDDVSVSRPIINDIKFNAVKIIQKSTENPEYFSISKNEKNKVCKLSSNNVANVEVWVDETDQLNVKQQEKFLTPGNKLANVKYDELGNIESIWVKWKEVENLISCGMEDRVYEVDYPKGQVIFGDGKKGKIPPEQYNESIKIVYSTCEGSKGNVEAKVIRDFVANVSDVQEVYNPSPVMGGVDMETVDSAAGRVFSQISGGNRLVTLSDFEDAIKFNDRNIYKVKCKTHTDEYGNTCIGTTSIAVLPRIYMQGYEKFQGMKNRIWNFIDAKAPATIARSTKLRVFEVGYVETSVSVDVVIGDFNLYQNVHDEIEEKLKKFLDPVVGNFSGKGWDIGNFPRKEFIYNYIKVVSNVKWIKSINIFTWLITPEGRKEVDFEYVKNKEFVVPVFGTPDINITVE